MSLSTTLHWNPFTSLKMAKQMHVQARRLSAAVEPGSTSPRLLSEQVMFVLHLLRCIVAGAYVDLASIDMFALTRRSS
jgi:hypothetical protein